MRIKITSLRMKQRDSRGEAFGFIVKNRPLFLLLYTKKGESRGHHYHPGKTKSKNPETIFQLRGKARLMAVDNKTGKKKAFLLKSPCKIEIYPNIYHEYHALTDTILLEPNQSADSKHDVVRPYGRQGRKKNK